MTQITPETTLEKILDLPGDYTDDSVTDMFTALAKEVKKQKLKNIKLRYNFSAEDRAMYFRQAFEILFIHGD